MNCPLLSDHFGNLEQKMALSHQPRFLDSSVFGGVILEFWSVYEFVMYLAKICAYQPQVTSKPQEGADISSPQRRNSMIRVLDVDARLTSLCFVP